MVIIRIFAACALLRYKADISVYESRGTNILILIAVCSQKNINRCAQFKLQSLNDKHVALVSPTGVFDCAERSVTRHSKINHTHRRTQQCFYFYSSEFEIRTSQNTYIYLFVELFLFPEHFFLVSKYKELQIKTFVVSRRVAL